MGFLKKITRPISKVLDKVIPNEIKPALPFLAAAVPFLAPTSGIFGTMAGRAALSGGANLLSQLSQEGSEGDFSGLSALLAAGTGALSAPQVSKTNLASPGDYFRMRSELAGGEGFTNQGLEYLAKGADFLGGGGPGNRAFEGSAVDILGKGGTKAGFDMATAKAAAIPFTQATTDLAVADARRLEKQAAIDEALAQAELLADSGARAAAIRQFMEGAGYFSDEEIEETISAAGYADGGRVGLEFGGIPAAVEAVEEKPKEFLVDKLKVTIMPGQSEEMGILNAMFNDVEGVMPDDRKMEFYKLYIPQLYERGEISKAEFEGMKEDILGEGKKDGGLMSLGGKEMDLRGGGFVPIGKKERADDVPARLSKNEFVMTADAVRGAGGGDINKGAKRMYETMNRLEARA